MYAYNITSICFIRFKINNNKLYVYFQDKLKKLNYVWKCALEQTPDCTMIMQV